MVLAHLGHSLVAQSLRLLRAEVWSSGADVRWGGFARGLQPSTSLLSWPTLALSSPVPADIASTRR